MCLSIHPWIRFLNTFLEKYANYHRGYDKKKKNYLNIFHNNSLIRHIFTTNTRVASLTHYFGRNTPYALKPESPFVIVIVLLPHSMNANILRARNIITMVWLNNVNDDHVIHTHQDTQQRDRQRAASASASASAAIRLTHSPCEDVCIFHHKRQWQMLNNVRECPIQHSIHHTHIFTK